jgi:SAM-dependent methyltransferase
MMAEHTTDHPCPVCSGNTMEEFLFLPGVPTHCNLLWESRARAQDAPRGDLRLGFCRSCGHVYNLAFNPSLMEYTQAYENSLHFSPRFQAYADALAARLIDQYGIREKEVIDIGCGKGDFLALLCNKGDNRGYGFDPSFVPEIMEKASAERMTIIQDFYSPRYASYQADLVTCRHVLEHIQSPQEFVKNVRASVGSRTSTVVFFEVPNVMYTLRDMGIWDLIYEHCSYFSASSLAVLFSSCGFKVQKQTELYEGQFLGIDVVPGTPAGEVLPDVRTRVAEMDNDRRAFAENYRRKVDGWKKMFDTTSSQRKVVVWGGGSKGVMFLNTLRPEKGVEYMVDINPRKQGMFVAGTGQEIVGPEFLRRYRPDTVIIMNAIYREEIRGQLQSLGVNAEIMEA